MGTLFSADPVVGGAAGKAPCESQVQLAVGQATARLVNALSEARPEAEVTDVSAVCVGKEAKWRVAYTIRSQPAPAFSW
ncbi:MAG: hypothetical protein SFW67_03805 [Myxococcaceae bacterium]|nr:hypothetical protein [Myxococcaceae bacterium]